MLQSKPWSTPATAPARAVSSGNDRCALTCPCCGFSLQDNTLLLGFGATVAAVTLGALGMMWAMQHHLTATQAAQGKLSVEETQAAVASNREAGCYMSTNRTAEALLQTRPGV